MSINRWMKKQTWDIHTMKYYPATKRKEARILQQHNMGTLETRCVLKETWHTRPQTTWFHWNETSRTGRFLERKQRISGCQGLKRKEIGSDCWMGPAFLWGRWRASGTRLRLRPHGGAVSALSATRPYTSKRSVLPSGYFTCVISSDDLIRLNIFISKSFVWPTLIQQRDTHFFYWEYQLLDN